MASQYRHEELELFLEKTPLSSPQINLLLTMSNLLAFGESVTQLEMHLFVADRDGEFLAIKDGRKGRRIESWSPEIMPLWAQVLSTGTMVAGLTHYYHKQECMLAYPIVDNGGKTIGGLSFTDPRLDSIEDLEELGRLQVLTESVSQTIMVAREQEDEVYEPISYQDGVIIFDDEGLILYGNEAANRLVNVIGFDRRLVGSSIYGSALKLSFLKTLIQERRAAISTEIYQDLVIRQVVIPIAYGRGLGRYFLFLQDKTVESKRQQELLVKNSVIKEIHHRVKNNLQTVAGLLRMEARRSDLPAVKSALQESISRIESMALVHDIVSHYDEDYISIRSIFDELSRLLRHSLVSRPLGLEFIYGGQDIVISSHQAGYVSLIINELITNSLEHGLEESMQHFLISLKVREQEGAIYLTYTDTGLGLPADFSLEKSKRLGLQIIRNLVEHELKGHLSIANGAQSGVVVEISMGTQQA